MEFDSDVAYVLVEFLSKSKSPVSQMEILDDVPFDKRSVTGLVFSMCSTGFVVKEGSASAGEHEVRYSINKAITAYQIIKLGELGLDMNSLSSLVKISDRQKQAAMALAMQTEKLAEMDGELRAQRAEAIAKTTSASPLPRDAIVDTLERLALASEMSIKEMKGVKASDEVLKALVDAKEQALKALLQYQSQLGQSGAEHLGF